MNQPSPFPLEGAANRSRAQHPLVRSFGSFFSQRRKLFNRRQYRASLSSTPTVEKTEQVVEKRVRLSETVSIQEYTPLDRRSFIDLCESRRTLSYLELVDAFENEVNEFLPSKLANWVIGIFSDLLQQLPIHSISSAAKFKRQLKIRFVEIVLE